MRFWFLTCLLMAAVASAAPKKPVVVVDGSPAMVKLLSKSLGAKYAVIAAGKRGGEVAFINVTTEGKQLTLSVLNAADGAELGVVSVAGTAKKPPKSLPKPKLNALLTALGAAHATPPAAKPEPQPPEPAKTEPPPAEPAREEPQPAEEKPVEPPAVTQAPTPKPAPEPVAEEKPAAPAPAEPSAPAKPPPHFAFRASVQGGIFNRNLYAVGSLTDQPYNSSHPASGAFSAALAVYPGAGFTSNFLAHLGAFISADFGLNLRSRAVNGSFHAVHSSSRLRFGALGRIPLSDDFSLELHAGYSRHTLFTYVVEANVTNATPDMLLNGFRGGALARWHLAGPVELEFGGAAQYVASLGSLRVDFPKATAFAIDATLAFSIELVEHLRLRFSGEWQRYFITLNGDASSPYQTRAVGDQYVWVSSGLQWSM